MALATALNDHFQNFQSFFRISSSYFRRRNPIMNGIANTIKSVYVLMTSGKRLKALKYQVQLMYYRMHQMDKLIQENNPTNFKGGSNLNSYR